MSSDDFDDIIRGFREEREAATTDEELLGPEPVSTSLLLIPVREAEVLAGVLKSGGAQGTVLATEQGCLVSLGESSKISSRDLAVELSGMLPGADLLLLTKQGGPQDEGQMACERVRDGQVVDKPVVALVIDALPAQARKVLLMGETLTTSQGAIDIGTSPDPPADKPPLSRIPPRAQRAMTGLFDIVLTSMVLLGGLLLIMQGALAEGGVSWLRIVFGLLATGWCVWRLSPSGRARVRRP